MVDCNSVLPLSDPISSNVHHGQVRHFQRAVIRGKDRFRLGHLPQLPIDPLNGVGGVDQPAHLLEILEIGIQIGPVDPPGLRNLEVFLP